MESSSSSFSSMDYSASSVHSDSLDSSRSFLSSSYGSSPPPNSGSETSRPGDDYADVMCDEQLHEPLYPGSNISLFQSYQQIFQYGIRHHLTKVAFNELLELFANHLPATSVPSLYKLRKFFMTLYSEFKFNTHYCCSSCLSPCCWRSLHASTDVKQTLSNSCLLL